MGLIVKVLASDFDNTLFFRNIGDGFKEEDIKAILEFQHEGHLFGMCSGRPLAGLLGPLNGIIKPDFYIVSTGGLILDKDYHVLFSQKIPFDIANEIYETYKDEIELLPQTLSLEDVYITRPHKDDEHAIQIISMEDMRGKDIYSFSLIQSTVERASQITKEINEKYDEVDAYQNVDSIDVVYKGCSKGTAVLRLKELFHIEKIAGIGDSYNDLPMLNVVDQAFTFHTSPKVIKKEANYVVSSIKEAIDILKEE